MDEAAAQQFSDVYLPSDVNESVENALASMRDMSGDNVVEELQKYRSHIPQKLPSESCEINDVINNLKALLAVSLTREEQLMTKSDKFMVFEVDARSTALLNLQSYLSLMDQQCVKPLTKKLQTDTIHWLASIFKFDNSRGFFHLREVEGVVSACRMALHRRFPQFALEGFTVWADTKPVIYLSQCAAPGWGELLIRQLGLPSECLRTVKCNNTSPNQVPSDTIDTDFLADVIKDDLAKGLTPTFLVAHAGTWLMGQTDVFTSLAQLCKTHSIWLHVSGHNLATLALASPPDSVKAAASAASSLTLQPREWLGVASSPLVTLYSDSDPSLAAPAGVVPDWDHVDVQMLPLWGAIQMMGGARNISNVIQANANMSQQLSNKLASVDQIYQVVQPAGAITSIILFQFTSLAGRLRARDKAATKSPKGLPSVQHETSADAAFQDAVNIWLYKKMRVENPRIVLELVQVRHYGVCLRFTPVASALLRRTSVEDVNEACSKLKLLVNSVLDTIEKRQTLVQLVPEFPNLRLHACPDWAGIAVVSYVPDYCEKEVLEGITIPDHAERLLEEIERVNKKLVVSMATAFPAVIVLDGRASSYWAVKVGVVDKFFDPRHFLQTLNDAGKALEDSSAFMGSLGSVVSKMIEAANEQLLQEQTQQFWNEGIVRHIPLFGSMYSYLLPPANSPVKGRSFNLSSGSLETTDFTHEHKLQLQQESPKSEPAAEGDVES